MSSAPARPREVDDYLAAVRDALGDLPTAEREDLLAEVEASLAEAAEDGPLVARLGAPEDFAAELRAAAGLHAAPAAAADRPLLRLLRRGAGHPRLRALRRTLGELAPLWWVARAYVVVGVVALASHAAWSTAYPVVPRLHSGGLGLAAIVVAACVSVWLGLRTRGRVAVAAANVVLAALAVPVVVHLADHSTQEALARAAAPVVVQTSYVRGLAYDGVPVDNVYPYSRDGRLLHDVLLYTGAGRPIEIGAGITDPTRRVARTANGQPLFNAFPIRYFEPGTTIVLHPDATPLPRVPHVATPPLPHR